MSGTRRDLILRGGRVLCAGSAMPEPVEIRIGGNGRIAAIAPVLPDGDAQVCALDGQLVLPGLIDIHQHLDKSRTRALVSNPSGTLAGASAAYRMLAPTITQDQMIARALQTVEACSAYGTRRDPKPHQYRSAIRRPRHRGHGRAARTMRGPHAYPDCCPRHLGRHVDAAGEQGLAAYRD